MQYFQQNTVDLKRSFMWEIIMRGIKKDSFTLNFF